MSEPQRQHPVAAITKALDILRGNLITILVLIFLGGGGEQASFTLYWILGTILLLLIWGFISWLRFSFSVEEGELRIEQGVLVRKKLYLTSDRIQVIDISAGVVQRLFGLVAVEVKTAGSTSKEAKISALTHAKAEELKELLRRQGEADAGASQREAAPEFQSRIYSLDTRDLLIAATTSGRLGVAISIVGAAFSQVDQFVSDERIIRFIEMNIPASTSFTVIVFSIAGILLVSWLLSFFSTIVAHYDFRVEVKEKELLISRGLFERTQLTIPFNRIQAVQIKEELLRQPLGYASLIIESAGYGEKEGNSTVLFPLISRSRLYEFIAEVIPEYDVEPEQNTGRLPFSSLRRYLLRMLWLSLIFIAVVWISIPYGIYAWFMIIPALLLGYRQYLDAGVSRGGNSLILSSRILSKTTVIVKKYRVQAAEIQRNPFQSRLRLSNFTVYVASGNQGRSFTVREIPEPAARGYLDWISDVRRGVPAVSPGSPPVIDLPGSHEDRE